MSTPSPQEPVDPATGADDARPDPFRTYLSTSWWPPPPGPTADGVERREQGAPTPAPALAPPRRSVLRTVGVALLGLLGGLLAGIVLQDLLAVALLRDGGTPPVAGLAVLASLLPVLAIGGAVVAVVVDRRGRRAGR